MPIMQKRSIYICMLGKNHLYATYIPDSEVAGTRYDHLNFEYAYSSVCRREKAIVWISADHL